MAIRDLIYACVECGREAGLTPAGEKGIEVCSRCGTRYQRADGAMIRCEPPGRPPETRHPSEWLDLIGGAGIAAELPGRIEPVIVRIAGTDRPLAAHGEYLGRIEQFGPPLQGKLQLTAEALIFQREGAGEQTWPLAELTAVQPSSTSLQIKLRKGPVISLRFPAGSALLWEERVRGAVQRTYDRLGRGEILEFQPRILCR